MRKVSKNRADDDVVSSTNGSVMNDDQTETEPKNDEKGSDTDADDLEKDDERVENSKETPKRGRSGKSSKGRKKKAEKENKVADESEEEEYEVERVVDSKKIKGKLHYLIRWKGYSADNDTWEPENTLSCPELINKYNDEKENGKNKDASPAPKGKKKRKSSKKESKSPSKRPKTEWDSKSADANAEYEVDRILEVHHKKTGKREFLIHWKGWSSKFDSWEPENNLNCPDLIKKFMDKVSSAKSTDSRSLRVAPETTNRFTLQDPSSGRRLSKRRGQRQRVRYDDMTE